MAKIDLINLASLQNETSAVSTINTNNSRVEAAIENTLSRDGTAPNEMNTDLDMNDHRIYNLPKALDSTEPVRKAEFDQLILDIQAKVGPAYLTSYDNSESGLAATNVQDAIDEIDAAVDAINTNFAENVDDRVAAFLQAGTNITLTYSDVLNTLTISASGSSGGNLAIPSDYGAVGDGVANDTAAIQDLLDSGKLIYLTPGTYSCNSLTIPAGATVLGTRDAILKARTTTGTFIQLGGDNIHLEGFTVDGTYTNATVASGFVAGHYGIKAYSGTSAAIFNLTLRNLLVKNFGESGIDLRIVTKAHVSQCEVHRCGYGGIMIWSGLNCIVEDNYIHDIFPGNAAGGADAPFQNAYGATFSNYGIDRISQYCTFRNNIVGNVPTWEGLDEHNGSDIQFIDNMIFNCSQGVACQHGIAGQPARRIVVRGNTIYGYGASTTYNGQTCYPLGGVVFVGGVAADQAELIKVNDNLIYNIGDNRPISGASGGIMVMNARNFQVNDNQIYIAYKYGISLTNSGSDSLLYGTVHGNIVDSVISVSGTQYGIRATSRVLADVQGNFLQSSGGASQVGSPTYITTFSNNRSI